MQSMKFIIKYSSHCKKEVGFHGLVSCKGVVFSIHLLCTFSLGHKFSFIRSFFSSYCFFFLIPFFHVLCTTVGNRDRRLQLLTSNFEDETSVFDYPQNTKCCQLKRSLKYLFFFSASQVTCRKPPWCLILLHLWNLSLLPSTLNVMICSLNGTTFSMIFGDHKDLYIC